MARRPTRKHIREEDYQITAMDPATGDELSQEVKGVANPEQAMQRVRNKKEFSDPKGKVTVSPKTPGGGASPLSTPATSGQKAKSQTTGMAGLTETFDATKFRYDYTIGLPGGFSEFMKKTKGRTKGLVVERREGRVYMTVESPEAMDKLMGKLKKSSRSRTVETRDKSLSLIRGIVGSMK